MQTISPDQAMAAMEEQRRQEAEQRRQEMEAVLAQNASLLEAQRQMQAQMAMLTVSFMRLRY